MFWKLPDDTYRLIRPWDHPHPLRKGKMKPEREELPERYRYLLNWYECEYYPKDTELREEDDPVLQMAGGGQEMWAGPDPDEYVRSLRSNWYGDEPEDNKD